MISTNSEPDKTSNITLVQVPTTVLTAYVVTNTGLCVIPLSLDEKGPPWLRKEKCIIYNTIENLEKNLKIEADAITTLSSLPGKQNFVLLFPEQALYHQQKNRLVLLLAANAQPFDSLQTYLSSQTLNQHNKPHFELYKNLKLRGYNPVRSCIAQSKYVNNAKIDTQKISNASLTMTHNSSLHEIKCVSGNDSVLSYFSLQHNSSIHSEKHPCNFSKTQEASILAIQGCTDFVLQLLQPWKMEK